jgi:ectoine hydroxylase-related dioxygenase (phytanoyl-CoA dioxygenase family)
MEFYERLLEGEPRHFDFTWVRVMAPGRATPPHCDIVYMGRGTTNLYTLWTPFGDVAWDIGGLMILENSHKIDRLREGYGKKDVDAWCVNKKEKYEGMGMGGNVGPRGFLSDNPARIRTRLGGRWLSTQFRMGDLLTFGMYMVHGSLDNASNRIRISTDSRYQLASEPVDERWIGEHPIGHGEKAARGMIC